MRRFHWFRGVVVFGLAASWVGVVPGGVSAAVARGRCRATVFVANDPSDTVSTIDATTLTKNPTAITVGAGAVQVAITPDGKTAFVPNAPPAPASTLPLKTT